MQVHTQLRVVRPEEWFLGHDLGGSTLRVIVHRYTRFEFILIPGFKGIMRNIFSRLT